jgi:hypothetical protein
MFRRRVVVVVVVDGLGDRAKKKNSFDTRKKFPLLDDNKG